MGNPETDLWRNTLGGRPVKPKRRIAYTDPRIGRAAISDDCDEGHAIPERVEQLRYSFILWEQKLGQSPIHPSIHSLMQSPMHSPIHSSIPETVNSPTRTLTLEHRQTGQVINLSIDRAATLERFIARRAKRLRAWERPVATLIKANPELYGIKLITATYRDGVDWQPKHITDLVDKLHAHYGVKLVAVEWTAELHEGRGEHGVPHYHLVAVYLREGARYLPTPDEGPNPLWPHGATSISNRETLGIGYQVTSYQGKAKQLHGQFPRGMHKFNTWLNKDHFPKALYWPFKLSAQTDAIERAALETMSFDNWRLAEVRFPRKNEWGEWWAGKLRLRSEWRPLSWLESLGRWGLTPAPT